MASDTRNRILSVAARLFETLGFEGTAVAAILREADVNSGSLYHFFPSKEALLVAVLEKYVEVLEPALLGAATGPQTIRSRRSSRSWSCTGVASWYRSFRAVVRWGISLSRLRAGFLRPATW